MSTNEEYNGVDDGDEMGNAGPGAPTPLTALEGVGGLTKRDIQLVINGGYNTVESVAYTPRRVLEQIKGISEQKADKILTEGKLLGNRCLVGPELTFSSFQARAHGLHHRHRNAPSPKRADLYHNRIQEP